MVVRGGMGTVTSQLAQVCSLSSPNQTLKRVACPYLCYQAMSSHRCECSACGCVLGLHRAHQAHLHTDGRLTEGRNRQRASLVYSGLGWGMGASQATKSWHMLLQAAMREGASIETGAPVESVLVGADGAAHGVRLAGGEEACRPSPPETLSPVS